MFFFFFINWPGVEILRSDWPIKDSSNSSLFEGRVEQSIILSSLAQNTKASVKYRFEAWDTSWMAKPKETTEDAMVWEFLAQLPTPKPYQNQYNHKHFTLLRRYSSVWIIASRLSSLSFIMVMRRLCLHSQLWLSLHFILVSFIISFITLVSLSCFCIRLSFVWWLIWTSNIYFSLLCVLIFPTSGVCFVFNVLLSWYILKWLTFHCSSWTFTSFTLKNVLLYNIRIQLLLFEPFKNHFSTALHWVNHFAALVPVNW